MSFRVKMLDAAIQMQTLIGEQNLGKVYTRVLHDSQKNSVIVLVNKDCAASGGDHQRSFTSQTLRWMSVQKLQKKCSPSTSSSGPAVPHEGQSDLIMPHIPEIISYFEESSFVLSKGLYLGFLKMQASVESIGVLAPQATPNIMPYARIRTIPNVSKPEWDWLLSSNEKPGCEPHQQEVKLFRSQLLKAIRSLADSLGISVGEGENYRLYNHEVLELSPTVSFIIMVPPREEVCSLGVISPSPASSAITSPKCEVGTSNSELKVNDLTTIPLPVFEMIHMRAYQPDFLIAYAKLSSSVETDLQIAQQQLREAFTNEETEAARRRVQQLTQSQERLDETRQSLRWSHRILMHARDKQCQGIPLSSLSPPPLKSTVRPMNGLSRAGSDMSLSPAKQSGPVPSPRTRSRSIKGLRNNSPTQGITKQFREIGTGSDKSWSGSTSGSDMGSFNSGSQLVPPPRRKSLKYQERKACDYSLDHNHNNYMRASPEPATVLSPPPPLRVWAAYTCGLPKGTSVNLVVTPTATAREVVNLVLSQLNKAAAMKGRGKYAIAGEKFSEFTLVCVVGSDRERVLRDDCCPLSMRPPWDEGRLFVRCKSDLVAAVTTAVELDQAGQGPIGPFDGTISAAAGYWKEIRV